MGRLLRTILLSVIVSVSYVFGCSPGFPVHMQNRYCDAKRVIAGKVIHVKAIGDLQTDPNFNQGKFRYTVHIWSVLKGYGQNAVGKFRYVFTSGNGGLCKLSLDVGKAYLLGGKKQGKHMYVLDVNLHSEYTQLTINQLFYLYTKLGEYSYHDNCDCKVTTTNGLNTCAAEHSNSDCLNQKDICRKKNGQCSWLKNDC